MSGNSYNDDAGWTYFTGEQAFKQLKRICELIWHTPDKFRLYDANVVIDWPNEVKFYIIDVMNRNVLCKAEHMMYDQLMYIRPFVEDFAGDKRLGDPRLWNPFFCFGMRLQVHKTMSRQLEAAKVLVKIKDNVCETEHRFV